MNRSLRITRLVSHRAAAANAAATSTAFVVPRRANATTPEGESKANSGLLQAVSRFGALAGTVMLGAAFLSIKWRSNRRREEREWRLRNGLPAEGVAPTMDEIPDDAKAAMDAIADAFRIATPPSNDNAPAPPQNEAQRVVAQIFDAAKQAPKGERGRPADTAATPAVAPASDVPRSIPAAAVAPVAEPAPTTTTATKDVSSPAEGVAVSAPTAVESVAIQKDDVAIVVVEPVAVDVVAVEVVAADQAKETDVAPTPISVEVAEEAAAEVAAVVAAEALVLAAAATLEAEAAAPAESNSQNAQDANREPSVAALVAVMEEGMVDIVAVVVESATVAKSDAEQASTSSASDEKRSEAADTVVATPDAVAPTQEETK